MRKTRPRGARAARSQRHPHPVPLRERGRAPGVDAAGRRQTPRGPRGTWHETAVRGSFVFDGWAMRHREAVEGDVPAQLLPPRRQVRRAGRDRHLPRGPRAARPGMSARIERDAARPEQLGRGGCAVQGGAATARTCAPEKSARASPSSPASSPRCPIWFNRKPRSARSAAIT